MTLEDMGPGVLYPLRSMEKTFRGTKKRVRIAQEKGGI
ncbi:rCG63668 [Rattus norvegicus]|uniref:RCG63668 n=1 Tax=Rattus norvegicus TaxID=10116 RepID=A6IWV4_RAT|nr:rCG63668 [Rattus norvegicus]